MCNGTFDTINHRDPDTVSSCQYQNEILDGSGALSERSLANYRECGSITL